MEFVQPKKQPSKNQQLEQLETESADVQTLPPKSLVNRVLLDPKFIVVVCVLLLAVAAVLLLRQNESAARGESSDSPTAPSYQTVLPDGKTIDDLGGWKRVNPPDTEPVFAYADSIDGVSISVSQQTLPAAFASDTDSHVAELAKGYNANKKITAGNTTAYVGTSAKGPQSVIFTKNNLLVLIKSKQEISDLAWANYIKSLITLDRDGVPKY